MMTDSEKDQSDSPANQTFNFNGPVSNFATGSQNFSQQAIVGPTLTQQNLTVDLPKLASELVRLRSALRGEAEPEQMLAATEVHSAELEAEKAEPDKSKIKGYLEKAGKVAYDMATKIGASIAVEAIKQSTGIGGPHH